MKEQHLIVRNKSVALRSVLNSNIHISVFQEVGGTFADPCNHCTCWLF